MSDVFCLTIEIGDYGTYLVGDDLSAEEAIGAIRRYTQREGAGFMSWTWDEIRSVELARVPS